MPTLSLQGRSIHYRDTGQGRPVLLLHAFPLSSDSFWPLLERPVPGVRFIAPDHRGFGGSSPGEGPSTMEAMARDALAVLDALGLGPVVVAGVSMGGYVAMALVRLEAMRVAGLVLVDTQHLADDEAGKARRSATAEQVMREGAAGIARAMMPRLLSGRAPAQVRDRVERLILAQSPSAIAAASLGMGERPDSKELLARFSGPAAVVVGEDDPITPPAVAQAMVSLLPAGQLHVIPGAGHLAHLEQPDAVRAIIEDLIGRLGPA